MLWNLSDKHFSTRDSSKNVLLKLPVRKGKNWRINKVRSDSVSLQRKYWFVGKLHFSGCLSLFLQLSAHSLVLGFVTLSHSVAPQNSSPLLSIYGSVFDVKFLILQVLSRLKVLSGLFFENISQPCLRSLFDKIILSARECGSKK